MTWRTIPLVVSSVLVACSSAEAPPAPQAKAVAGAEPAATPAPVAEASEGRVAVTITYCIP